MKTFLPLYEDPEPAVPDEFLHAILNVFGRDGRKTPKTTLSKKAKRFAKPYANRAKELLYQEGE
jgi:hypothetical protein